MGLSICSIDINGAFLYPEQKRLVYILLPILLTDNKCYWKLNKTLYGLRESPQAFYDDVSSFLLANSFTRTIADPCMFFKRKSDTEFIMVVVHVDDFAIAASTNEIKQEFLSVIRTRYKFKECQSVQSFLGIHIDYLNDGSVLFSQPARIADIIRTYNLGNTKSPIVPMCSTFNDDFQNDSPSCDYNIFMTLLGVLLFVVKTRPDIAYSVNRLATRASKATIKDFEALLRVASYLGGTIELGIRFVKKQERNITEATQLRC
jgi:dimeric dUTPase (all-alpha-NTP-PPase superfamily)